MLPLFFAANKLQCDLCFPALPPAISYGVSLEVTARIPEPEKFGLGWEGSVTWSPEVVELEDVRAALRGRRDDLRRLDLDEIARRQCGPESSH